MEHIDGCVIGHDCFHIGEGIQQELIERVIIHIVILDLTSGAFIVHIVRRIRDHQVCLLASH